MDPRFFWDNDENRKRFLHDCQHERLWHRVRDAIWWGAILFVVLYWVLPWAVEP